MALKRQGVPKDILKALEVDAESLDEMVHDAKGEEAAAINNEGYWSQLDYLVGEGFAGWDQIREHLGLPVPVSERPQKRPRRHSQGKKPDDLTPPDFKRCQAERREGSFMTFGRPEMVRCEKKPVFIARENQPAPDGKRGSMSLCAECAERFKEKFGENYATLIPIGKKG